MINHQAEPVQINAPEELPGSKAEPVTRVLAGIRSTYAESWPTAKPAESKRPSWRQALEDDRHVSAMEALSRLLRFQETLQSTSGRGKHLRDFAKANEGTRAAHDAIILAGGMIAPGVARTA